MCYTFNMSVRNISFNIKLAAVIFLLAGSTTAYAVTSQPEQAPQPELEIQVEELEEEKPKEKVVQREAEPEVSEPVIVTPPVESPEPTPEPKPEPEEVKPTIEELKAYAKTKVINIPDLLDHQYYAVQCFNNIADWQFQWQLTYSDIDEMVAVMTESKTPCGHLYVYRNTGDYRVKE